MPASAHRLVTLTGRGPGPVQSRPTRSEDAEEGFGSAHLPQLTLALNPPQRNRRDDGSNDANNDDNLNGQIGHLDPQPLS